MDGVVTNWQGPSASKRIGKSRKKGGLSRVETAVGLAFLRMVTSRHDFHPLPLRSMRSKDDDGSMDVTYLARRATADFANTHTYISCLSECRKSFFSRLLHRLEKKGKKRGELHCTYLSNYPYFIAKCSPPHLADHKGDRFLGC